MKKKFLILLLFISSCFSIHAQKYNKLLKAIIKIESNGKTNAKNGICAGILQITPHIVNECNKIQKQYHFTLKDRFDKNKSIQMFNIYQNKYNPSGDIETAIRIWNGGINYSIKKTNRYYTKIMKHYNALPEDSLIM